MPPKKSATKAEAPTTKKSAPAAKASKSASTAKGAAMKASSTAGGEASDNTPLIKAFQELMMYEGKVNKWASVAYNKVVKILVAHPTKISSSADVADKDGVGKASKEKIDEFLTTGTIKKLDEYRGEYGELAEEVKVAAKTVKVTPKPPTAAVKKSIKEAKEKFMEMSSDALKALLKANRQSSTGNKDELSQRCAEGLVLGAIPACPLCYAGRPRFELKTGIYKCPGYMDDADFKACFFESTDLKRDPWNSV